jgi:NAD(P)H-dependent flavin oxidoreductase YrpB (nitropropane dioxygenase family)
MANRVDSKAWTENQLTSHLGLQYPIIQGPLGGLSSQRLTAAVSNYGGLGSFGAHGLKPDANGKVVGEIKALTTKPFAINLWVSMEDEGASTSTEEAFHRSLTPLAKHIESVAGTICDVPIDCRQPESINESVCHPYFPCRARRAEACSRPELGTTRGGDQSAIRINTVDSNQSGNASRHAEKAIRHERSHTAGTPMVRAHTGEFSFWCDS